MKTPCIYTITNKLNGTIYVGKSFIEENRWSRHLRIANGGKEKYPKVYSYIHAAINKYGEDNFIFEIKETFQTEQEAFDKEVYMIADIKSKNMKVYNLTDGGEGSSGYKHTPETISKISGENNAFYGKQHSQKSKDKISKSLRGSSNPCYGKPRNEKTKKLISKKLKGKFKGKNNPMFGKHHSDETKTKQSNAKKKYF